MAFSRFRNPSASQGNYGPGTSEPESYGNNPDTSRLSIHDYTLLMQAALGAMAEQSAQVKRLADQAADRTAVVRVNKFDTDITIPTSQEAWRTCYISRPSMAEYLYTTGLTAKDLTVIFDETYPVIVPFYGQIIVPVFGFTHFKVENTGPGGAGTYPATWAMELTFTTRQYNPTQWAVSA